MAQEFASGFESGTPATVFTALSTTPTFVQDAPATARSAMLLDVANEYGRWDLSANAVKVAHVRVRVSTFAGADFVQFIRFQNAADSLSAEIGIGNDADRRLFLSHSFGGTVLDSFPAISASTYYRVAFMVDATANPWSMAWEVDGVSQGTFAPALAATTFTKVFVGNPSGDAWVFRLDDVAIYSGVTAEYPPGDVRVDGYAVGTTRPDFSRYPRPMLRV